MANETIKVYPNKNGEAHVLCPKCGNFQKIKAFHERENNTSSEMLWTCKCGFNFPVFIELRKYYRKEVNLYGVCITAGNNESEINIQNISRNGIGFTMSSQLNVTIGDILYISFMLPGRQRSAVIKNIVTRRIEGIFIGAEFVPHIDERDKDVAFYLTF